LKRNKVSRIVGSADIELLNYARGLKEQLSDAAQLGGKLNDADKRTLIDACKSALDFADENATGTKEEFEEQKEKLSQILHPITSKLYQGEGTGGGNFYNHEEL
jgi:heat shock protein 5